MRNYATQMDAAKRGIVTPEIETVAKKENRPVEFIMERVAKGTIAIPANINHKKSVRGGGGRRHPCQDQRQPRHFGRLQGL